MKQIFYSLCLFLLMMQGAFADDPFFYKKDIEIGQYELISKVRLERELFQYTYKLTLKNISNTRLKNVRLSLYRGISGTDAPLSGVTVINGLLMFNQFEKGESRQSSNTFTIQTSRTESIDINNLKVTIKYQTPIIFKDSKGNEIALFIEESIKELITTNNFITIADNKNPTNKDLNNFPVITNNFIEIAINDPSLAQLPYSIDIHYTENPYRVLLLRNNETEWTPFINNKDKKIAELTAKPENGKLLFALIRRN